MSSARHINVLSEASVLKEFEPLKSPTQKVYKDRYAAICVCG
jgi:hypothetical protein